ncbi:hypothetical protein GQ44DRAFT_38555 [Phaeosphaeriaceae sp. PMI808]|nr:hypothetical protein GQ44DRAFT_38555 [Phaeosphaeriaceae sp. PMI808]
MVSSKNQYPDCETLDLLVIGAGICGVQAARTYLTIHPSHNVLILEADNSLGGGWSKERVYPYFINQSPLDIWEFSDKPLVLNNEENEKVYYEYFPGSAFARYLEEYANEHVFEGKTLRKRIICNARVESLRQIDGTWEVNESEAHNYTARKVIDATGLTSQPNIPSITGSETFCGIQIRSKQFGDQSSTILQPDSRVVIIGGGKSAGDIAYACAKSGVKDIHWVIRKSGNGPASYLPPDPPISKYGNSNSAFHTNLMIAIIASVYAPETIWTWFLYRTVFGRALHALLWMGLNYDVLGRARYDRHDAKAQSNSFTNLKPDGTLFWQLTGSGVNQRADFFDTIASQVKIYRQDISHISPTGLHLAGPTTTFLTVDAIIYATGWSTAQPPYLTPQLALDLGLPSTLSFTPSQTAHHSALATQADAQIIKRFPVLASPPKYISAPQ